MSKQTIPMIVTFQGAHNNSREIQKRISKRLRTQGNLNGYCEAKVFPAGIKIWVNSRQTEREMVDTFFHEMTHALLKIRFTKKPIRLTEEKAELLCGWIGYLCKQQFADMLPKIFGRR